MAIVFISCGLHVSINGYFVTVTRDFLAEACGVESNKDMALDKNDKSNCQNLMYK